jgi:hypothetical protein
VKLRRTRGWALSLRAGSTSSDRRGVVVDGGMTTWIGDRGDRGGGNGAKRKTLHQTSAGDGVEVGEIVDRKRSLNRRRGA